MTLRCALFRGAAFVEEITGDQYGSIKRGGDGGGFSFSSPM
jgi:hypothetical protein